MLRTRPATGAAVAVAAALVLAGCTQAGPSAGSSPSPSTGDPLVVQLKDGRIRGKDSGPVREYSGIRYAAPPVGALRWREPQPVEPWSGIADATKYGNICLQQPIPKAPPVGEDCLTVNVTVPRTGADGKLPVMVWWHGGGYTRDAGSLYGAQRLADQGKAMVVTVNYRLGMMGYLATPGLAGGGTFGLADQLQSLRWVRDNAAAFGGDPGNVTLFGQSAGGLSACAALTSPAIKGLVHRAIVTSGNCDFAWAKGSLFPGAPAQTGYAALRDVEALTQQIARELGCPNAAQALDCLRAKPAKALMPQLATFANQLAYGTPLLPVDPAVATRDGQFERVPLMVGTTRREMVAFMGGASLVKPITAADYPGLIRTAFGEHADDVARTYPLSRFGSPVEAWAQVATDSAIACPTDRLAGAWGRHAKVYGFEFADDRAPNVNNLKVPGVPMGATHASELPYLFALNGAELAQTPERRELSATMVGYWTTFARTGDPNGSGRPEWPEVSPGRNFQTLVQGKVGPSPRYAEDHHCELWQSFR